MSTTAQEISAYILKDLVWKLSPTRFPGIPSTLAALTGFILGARFCHLHITGVVVIASGTVLARTNADLDARRVIGSYSDVLRTWICAPERVKRSSTDWDTERGVSLEQGWLL
jgi:hypothetical protein